MKNLKFFTLAIAILGFTATSFAQNPLGNPQVSATATANANIITPLTIENNRELNFGNIVSGAEGTVTIASTDAGERSQTGGAQFPTTVLGTISSAKFTVSGFAGAAYGITMPVDDAIVLKNGSNEMKLKEFTNNAKKVLTGGFEVFYVGATLQVGAAQAAGAYTASFDIKVNYN